MKRLDKIHERIAIQLNAILEWTKKNTILDDVSNNSAMSKGSSKGKLG